MNGIYCGIFVLFFDFIDITISSFEAFPFRQSS